MEIEIIRIFASAFLISCTAYVTYVAFQNFYYDKVKFPRYVGECRKKGYVRIGKEHYKLIEGKTFIAGHGRWRYKVVEEPKFVVLTSSEKEQLNLQEN